MTAPPDGVIGGNPCFSPRLLHCKSSLRQEALGRPVLSLPPAGCPRNRHTMAVQGMVIVGTGGSGRETYALLRDVEKAHPGTWACHGFLGLGLPDEALLELLGAPFLGDPGDIAQRVPEAVSWHYALGIGNPVHRRAMDATLTRQGLSPASLVHPTALIGPDVEIGPGANICAHTVVTTNVRIGAGISR